MMLNNRRNLIFKVSIVINIALLLYAAVHISGTTPPTIEWMPVTTYGAERTEMRLINRDDDRNDTELRLKNTKLIDQDSPPIFLELLSQKTSTIATTNKTASSTDSILELEKKFKKLATSSQLALSTKSSQEVDLDIVDENALSQATLQQLRRLLMCNEKDFSTSYSQRGEFWVLKNYVRADHGTVLCHETVTYTTHAGFEFFDNIPPMVERWMGPVSVAVHAPGTDFQSAVNSIRYLRDCLNHDLVKQFVTFHLFFPYKHMPSKIIDPETFLTSQYNCTEKPPYIVNASTTYANTKSLLLPVNIARNIARDAALTHFILPSDIELYPSPFLIQQFLNMIARNEVPLSNSTNPRVFPITIFEVEAKARVPLSKTELRSMLANKTAVPFHKYVCPYCHNIPQSQQWMNAEETNRMDVFHVGKRRGKHVHWEPIYIGTNREPYYDERLSWQGMQDKMTQGYILCVKDYDFMILNNAFLVHKPGIKRYKKDVKRNSLTGRQGSFIKAHIMPELKKLFGTKSGCLL